MNTRAMIHRCFPMQPSRVAEWLRTLNDIEAL